MEHHAPHSSAAFEGYYSKFDLPSGAHIALIVCSVPAAASRPHMVSFTYYPPSGSPIFQREHWVSDIQRIKTGPGHAFELRVPDLGSVVCDAESTTTYSFECAEWSLKAMTAGHTPWHPKKDTPAGWIVRLPLPLHWHVQSLSSPCAFKLDIPTFELPKQDRSGRATVHEEKNWANSFPESHMWIQAYDSKNDHGICLAGGKILGMTAYLLGYRSPSLNVDFVPPFALSILGISPFMSIDIDWPNRAFSITVSDLYRKLVLKARAPKEGGWLTLSCPFSEGFRPNFCTESFLARLEVEVYERRGWLPWWGSWREVQRDVFESASLEFAGGYYPERGEKRE